MSEEDIRQYLSRNTAAPAPKSPRVRVARRKPEPAPDSFKEFSASHLFCPRCKQAMPVRERILLFLPDGDLYDYSCSRCGTSLGTRKAGT